MKEKYLSDKYYNNKRREFHELKLGHKSMEEHVHKFLEFLRYAGYIKNERVNIQASLEVFPKVIDIGLSLSAKPVLMKPSEWKCIVMSK